MNDANVNDDVIDELMPEPNGWSAQTQRKSSREVRQVQRYGNPVSYCLYVNYVNANVPSTYDDAINSGESYEWRKAMDTEILIHGCS